jgi:hypothetical protein
MHFCFLDHLHLSTGLKVPSSFQEGPYFSLILQNGPWLYSSPFFLLAPLLPCSACWRPCRRRSAPLLAAIHPPCFPLAHASPHHPSTALAPPVGALPARHGVRALPAPPAGASVAVEPLWFFSPRSTRKLKPCSPCSFSPPQLLIKGLLGPPRARPVSRRPPLALP